MSVQLAVNIPEKEFDEIQNFIKGKGLNFNDFILEAIKFWKKETELERDTKTYQDSYKRLPERLKEIEAWETASFSEFSQDNW